MSTIKIAPLVKSALSAASVAAVLGAAVLGVGAAVASAEPAPPPPPAVQGEEPPPWAPRKPAEFFDGYPVVWTSGWGGRWGVWINGGFLTLSSNPVTNGG